MDMREPFSSEQFKSLDTDGLRSCLLKESVFRPGELELTYSGFDRMIFGGAVPLSSELVLPRDCNATAGSDYLLEHRELGILNLGGAGRVDVNGQIFDLMCEDALYIGSGTESVIFYSNDATDPSKFYLFSAIAHVRHPTRLVRKNEAISVIKETSRGVGPRRIITYFSPAVLPTCQIVLGITRVERGTLWHTMPPHMHERRSEVFLYCNMDAETAAIQLVGKPEETRHLIMHNEDAVILPGWSIRPGVATGSFDIVWTMAGENREIADMDFVRLVDCR